MRAAEAQGVPSLSFRRPRSARPAALALLTALAVASFQARGQSTADATAPASPDEPVPLWEVGVVGIGAYSPAYPGSDQDFLRGRVLPYAIYRGPLLRLDGSGVGLRIFDTPRLEWEASAAGSFGNPSSRVRAREGMASIGTLVEVGPALKINLGDLLGQRDRRATRLELPVRAVFDTDAGFGHRGWTFEPSLSHTAWRSGTASAQVSASLLFGNRSLNRLYYGVGADEVAPGRPAYDARGGLVATRLGLSPRHRITPTLRLLWFAQLETVRGAANEASPLVRSRQDLGAGLSVTWGFWHSDRAGLQ